MDDILSENHSYEIQLEKNEDKRHQAKENNAKIIAAIQNLHDKVKKSIYTDVAKKGAPHHPNGEPGQSESQTASPEGKN